MSGRSIPPRGPGNSRPADAVARRRHAEIDAAMDDALAEDRARGRHRVSRAAQAALDRAGVPVHPAPTSDAPALTMSSSSRSGNDSCKPPAAARDAVAAVWQEILSAHHPGFSWSAVMTGPPEDAA
jgi:hypothetical protein